MFHQWQTCVPRDIDLCPIQLPGREDRHTEPCATDLSDLVHQLAGAMAPHLDFPFALYGHSMGALIVFELARRLRTQGLPAPVHLFVSGRRAPHIAPAVAPIHELPRAEFLYEVQRYGRMPPAILTEHELMNAVVPRLRADFQLLERYEYVHQKPLDSPISAFAGTNDRSVGRRDIEEWGVHTSRSFSVRMMPGDHFFPQQFGSDLLRLIAMGLRSSIQYTYE